MYLRNRVNHIQAHFNGTFRMVGSWFGQTATAIITVSENFYSQTMMILHTHARTQNEEKMTVKFDEN